MIQPAGVETQQAPTHLRSREGPKTIQGDKERGLRGTIVLTGSDVVPVGVVGSELLEGSGLDNVNPVGDLQLTRSLQVRRVSRDEGLGR